MKMKTMKQAKLLICVVLQVLLVSALPASAQRWCARQLTLFEGIAAINEGHKGASQLAVKGSSKAECRKPL
ncbi:hypothetical protein [Parasulfitobacter algicola]|uniref:Uncharacterized protein n=1 Tax=Parasulfitobacter algicola TaxID=2614809 RepID=A0ABX2IW27_9RHOB|nr:hypothetical protein [Sulfitobacter algicola]NSX54263.1 hypothetical protein [Sulfitobacter algicola]